MRRLTQGFAMLLSAALIGGVLAAGAPADASSRVDVFVGFRSTPGASDEAFVRDHGGEVLHRYSIVPAIAANVPERSVDRMRSDRRVTYVEEILDVVAVHHETELGNTWGVDRIEADAVHHNANTGSGLRVAVLDSGIDTNHPDVGYDSGCSKNFVDGETLEDGNGHGTHTAGTVGAVQNGKGVVGAAYGSTLCILKVLGNGGGGSYDDVVAALDYIVNDVNKNSSTKVRVTNNSYGSSGDPGTTVRNAFDNAYNAGVYHAGAAGNSGNLLGIGSNCIYPALYDSVVAIAATTKSDGRASFSSTCSQLELAAPGSSVNSTTNDGKYGTMSGTSMASPHVAGSAALVFAANSTWSPGQVRQALNDTAQDLGSSGHDSLYGYGLVRPDRAVGTSGGGGDTTTGTVSGTVTDASTGSGVSGAAVSVDTGQSATTDSTGSYSIADVPTGDRSVTASATGYQSQTKTATVSENTTATVNFALQPQTATGMTVSAIDYATSGGKANDRHLSVTVTVVDDAGKPVDAASVAIELSKDGSLYGSGSGTTGSDGKVTFTTKNAPSGCYSTAVIAVTKSGYTWDDAYPANQFCK